MISLEERGMIKRRKKETMHLMNPSRCVMCVVWCVNLMKNEAKLTKIRSSSIIVHKIVRGRTPFYYE